MNGRKEDFFLKKEAKTFALDRGLERLTRGLAIRGSRRGVLARLGRILAGATLMPVLPIDRARASAHSNPHQTDPTQCDYWKYCSMDGQLCSCCGGSSTDCPPGTQISKVSWVGTCLNGQDGRNYLVSYTDCCGRSSCGQCNCNANVGERPGYEMGIHNDINWCVANGETSYHCTISLIVGVAD
jgi:methylamine dehydrogenase light chain